MRGRPPSWSSSSSGACGARWVTETLSMVSSGTVANPVLVSIKAVDPQVYPFYGAVKLDPPASLAASA